jgi:hypothetical protein
MANAIKANDLRPAAEQAARAKRKSRRNAARAKTFETLTPPEKDQLLKTLAIRAGLITDSDD